MKKFLLLLAVFFIATLTSGQENPSSLLWKVTKKGSKNQSYLFGTFHEVSPAFFDALTNAVRKLKESDVLFVERRIPTGQALPVQNNVLWNFEKWQTFLTKDQKVVFREFVKKIADTSCYTQSPFELLLGITRNYLLTVCETDTDFTDLMDNYIEKLALKENKRVYALDSNQQSIINKAANELNKQQQDTLYAAHCIAGMKSTLDHDITACDIIAAYRNLKIDFKLDSTLKQSAADKALLVDRNSHWMATLDRAFSRAKCFVAVGFRHLCYKQGLIQQLRSMGYKVTPIAVKL